jgi:D-glycero-alpha-D-manno-heptose-7-phosphate kinase
MIITKTPFRVSFCGGGTDLPDFYKKYNGQVLSTTIDKYMYILVKKQTGIIEYKYKIHWNKTEFKNHISQINHPIIKKTLQYFKINYPIEISSYSDIPASTGLGSSSAFTVGLVKALCALQKKPMTKKKISEIASKIEVDLVKRRIGRQDHYATCYGGLNHIIFFKDDSVKVRKITISEKNKKKLENSLALVYTNMKRNADKVLSHQYKPNKDQSKYLLSMKKDVYEFKKILSKEKIEINEIGKFLIKQWSLKKKINKISTKKIDKMYDKLISLGAYGAKLLGAGQGGFLLLLSNKNVQKKIKNNFKLKNFIKIRFDNDGSKFVYRSENFIKD